MRSFFIVVLYTIMQTLKKKSFWISNIVMAIIITIVFMVISSLPVNQITSGDIFSTNDESLLLYSLEHVKSSSVETISNRTKQSLPKVLVKDVNGVLGDYINILSESNYNFIIDNDVELNEIKKQINEYELYSAVIINEKDNNISFDYITFQDSRYNKPDANLISDILKSIQNTKILANQGLTDFDIELINSKISYNIEEVNDISFLTDVAIVSIFLALILYFAIFFYSYNVASSVTIEKTSRVIETLITSAKSTTIIIGKTIGVGVLGLLQLLFLSLVSVVSFKSFVTADISFINNIIGSLDLSFINVSILFTYFILGYLLFAFLSAIAGTTANKPEDIQISNLPISLILIISLILSIFSTFFPDGDTSKFVSVFPITSAFAMPGRLLTGYAGYSEVIVSIMCLLFTILFIAFLATRIYSIGILHYGNRLKLKDLFNIFIKMK